MRSFTVSILHVFVALATAKEDSLNDVADMMFDKMLNKLVDKLIDRESPVQEEGPLDKLFQHYDLDDTTLGKINPGMASRGTSMTMRAQPVVPQSVSIAQDKLMRYGISPGPLETLALTAIDANNRGTGMRNVRAMAARMPPAIKTELSKLTDAVVVRAGAIDKMSMPGITAPMGFFDPLKYSEDIDDAKLVFYREAELRHGRYGMLASLGIFAGETFSPTLGASDPNIPAVKLFLQGSPVVAENAFWGGIILTVVALELGALNSKTQGPPSDIPGDIGFDPIGLKPKKPEDLLQMQNKELNNGRMAMLAAAGMIAQELVTGQKIF